ncbi:DUF2651 family protein [Crassaminicella indica]|uniref:YbeF family protein n=1 Tax=Crassaminicella indica TaxID=2855394 RepID=A0ABX8RDJ7_9CLOT|nr:YbeF family protein [Crassaminicella indica]
MEFVFIFLICPLSILIISVFGYIWFSKCYVIPLIVFTILTILTLTLFGGSFFIWVIIYTIFSLIISLTVRSRRNNDFK